MTINEALAMPGDVDYQPNSFIDSALHGYLVSSNNNARDASASTFQDSGASEVSRLISQLFTNLSSEFSSLQQSEIASAREQMAFQAQQTQQAMDYNALQAQINREFQQNSAREQMAFQERMSNTAYQRAVQDLKSAGLNPILAAGASASTPSGASSGGSSGSISALSGSKANLSGIVGSMVNVVGDAMNYLTNKRNYSATLRGQDIQAMTSLVNAFATMLPF